jgi:hypothetical protein
MSKPIGVAIFIGVIVLLFGYELISLIVSYRKIDEVDLDAIAAKKLSDKKNQK